MFLNILNRGWQNGYKTVSKCRHLEAFYYCRVNLILDKHNKMADANS